jgi:two-component system sensor histidine kinase KdpD
MSRLQAGALKPRLEAAAIEDIVPRAIDDVPEAAGRVRLESPEPGLPDALVDAPLLERVVANLVGNAVRHTDSPVTVTVSALGDHVEVRVIDRGPGIPEEDWDLVFRPFQRFGDRDNTTGVGLGLALSRGLAETMGGTLVPEETPGGGVTMVLSVPRAGAEDEASAQNAPGQVPGGGVDGVGGVVGVGGAGGGVGGVAGVGGVGGVVGPGTKAQEVTR